MRRTRGDTRRLPFFAAALRTDLDVAALDLDVLPLAAVFGLEVEDDVGAELLSDWRALAGSHKEAQTIPRAIERPEVRDDNTARNLSPKVGAHY